MPAVPAATVRSGQPVSGPAVRRVRVHGHRYDIHRHHLDRDHTNLPGAPTAVPERNLDRDGTNLPGAPTTVPERNRDHHDHDHMPAVPAATVRSGQPVSGPAVRRVRVHGHRYDIHRHHLDRDDTNLPGAPTTVPERSRNRDDRNHVSALRGAAVPGRHGLPRSARWHCLL